MRFSVIVNVHRAPRMARIGGIVHVIDSGRGPAVVLIHGTPSTAAYLSRLLKTLERDRRVLIPELPGYGKTPPLDGAYSLERVQQLLEDALLARGIHECAAVGFSGGSYRAMALALTSKRVRVTCLVTLGGMAGFDADVRASFRQFADLARDGFDFRPMWLGRMTSPGFAERFPAEAEEVLSWIDAAPRHVLAAELEAFANAPDLRPMLGSLAPPVTARVGALDQATPPAFSEAIAAAAPRGELQVVDGCGHALLYEDREHTVSAVAQALLRGGE